MATSGSRDKNPFRPGGNLGTTDYYLLVDRDGPNKGRITIKTKTLQGNIQGTDGDRTIGFIPLDNSFQPSTTANPDEIRFFATAAGQKLVKDKGIETVVNSGVSQQEATQLIRPNSALPGGTPTPTTLTPNEIQTEITNSPKSQSVENSLKVNLVYPTAIRTNKQDRIKFTAKKIAGRTSGSLSANERFSLGTRTTENLGSVTLPIQPSITDSNGVDWGGANLNPIQAYAASLSLDIAAAGGNITGEVADALNKAARDFKNNLGDYKKAIQIYFAQEAVGAQGLLSRTSGAILNPNLELLFNGPTLRPFNFTFRLSPRDKDEAKEVKAIINFFKKAMAVQTAETEVFLKTPNIFGIEYQTGDTGKPHKSLNRIKDCALLGCDIDYTPDGSYMTFNNEDTGYPMTSYQMTLRFSELDPIYNTDYASLEEGEIGF